MDNLLDVCWVKEAGHKRVHNIWSHSSEVLEQVKEWWKRIRKIVVLGRRRGLWRGVRKLSRVVAISYLVTWLYTHIKIHQIIHLRLCVCCCLLSFTLKKEINSWCIYFKVHNQEFKTSGHEQIFQLFPNSIIQLYLCNI